MWCLFVCEVLSLASRVSIHLLVCLLACLFSLFVNAWFNVRFFPSFVCVVCLCGDGGVSCRLSCCVILTPVFACFWDGVCFPTVLVCLFVVSSRLSSFSLHSSLFLFLPNFPPFVSACRLAIFATHATYVTFVQNPNTMPSFHVPTVMRLKMRKKKVSPRNTKFNRNA